MLTQKEKQILEALTPRASEEGIELVSVEVAGAKKAPTIRVYIDTPDGVSFDALSSSQAWINEIMDELDPFPGAYTLEVSSPGIDRPLRTEEHFDRFSGQEAVIQTKSPIEGRSKWTGILSGLKNECVVLQVENDTVEIGLENIKRARLKGTIDFSSK